MEEKIIKEILASADAEASSIIEDAQMQAYELVAQTQAEVDKEINYQRRKLEYQTDSIIDHKQVVANMERRKKFLMVKQDIINEIIANVQKKLVGMKDKDYLEFISKGIKKYAKDGDTLILAQKCKLSDGAVESLDVFSSMNLKLGERGDFSGGFILSNDICDTVLTFENILKNYRETKLNSQINKLMLE